MDNKPVPPTHYGFDLLNYELWRDHKWEHDPTIMIFPDKYVVGGENAGITTTVSKALTTQFESDVHFVQYTHSTETRLLKGTEDIQGLKFEICCFDLDNHEKHPTQEDFDKLMSYLDV